MPDKRPFKPAELVKDTRSESVSITIPCTLKGTVLEYDELGQSKTFTRFDRKDDMLVLQDVQLKGGEIKIYELR